MVIPADGEPMTLGLGDSAFAHSHRRFIQRGVHGSCNWSGRTRAASAPRPQRCDHVVVASCASSAMAGGGVSAVRG